jgi:hypothetical protein
LQIYSTSDKHTVHHMSVFHSPIDQIKVHTVNISHPIGHDEVDWCTLLSAVCKAAEGVPCVLLGRQFHTLHQDTVLT